MKRFLVALFFLLLSCGRKEFPDYRSDFPPAQYEVVNGEYRFSLTPLNNTRIRGHGLLWVRGNQFYAQVVINSYRPHMVMRQYLHTGSRCPDRRDDLNSDGLIDAGEAESASGKVLIPLDGKLNNQAGGNDWWPKTDNAGIYYYSRSAIVNVMMADLYDRRGAEGYGKLSDGEELSPELRTIIIYGSASDPLLPVACGKISIQ